MAAVRGDIFDFAPPFCYEHDAWYEFVKCDAGCEDGYTYVTGYFGAMDLGSRCTSCFGKGGVWVCPACGLVASRTEG